MYLYKLVVLLVLICVAKGADLWSWSYETSYKDISSVLSDAFEYSVTTGNYGIGDDDSLSVVEDPLNAGQYVLRVFYEQGTYSSYHSYGVKCASGGKCHRGAQFYAIPAAVEQNAYNTLTLQYEVMFDATFSFNKGGKLPGLFGGSRNCSGSRIGDTCFSTRLMWRSNGDGEVYAYVTHNQTPTWTEWCDLYDTSQTEKSKHIHCTSTTGIEIGDGSFQFQTATWHKIRQEVDLTTSAGQKGYIKLWVDDQPVIYVTDIIMRDNMDFNIDGIIFSTFFGGGSSSWACPNDTYTYYRNFKLSDDIMTINL